MTEPTQADAVMTVKVHTILGLVKVVGGRDVEMRLTQGSTVGDLLGTLDARAQVPLPFVRVMVNGRQVEFLEGTDTVLHDGDEILLLPPAAGG